MPTFSEILDNIQQYIENLFFQSDLDCLLYHNIVHTKLVVEKSNELASNYLLNETDHFILSASAWFHDTGHLNGSIFFHEDRSAVIMRKYFDQFSMDEDIVEKIDNCIIATKFSQMPETFLEEIICDADTYNLGTAYFLITDELLKQELEKRDMDTANWTVKTIELFKAHQYYTPYCKEKLNAGKEKNMRLLQSRLQMNK